MKGISRGCKFHWRIIVVTKINSSTSSLFSAKTASPQRSTQSEGSLCFNSIQITMDLKARKAANLSVLKRHDPSVVDLLDQSSHAVVYCFDQSKAGWVCSCRRITAARKITVPLDAHSHFDRQRKALKGPFF